MSKRYVVDKRIGCIAVIDTYSNFESEGLHEYNPNVVWYEHGIYANIRGSDLKEWNLKEGAIERAAVECDKWNAVASQQ